MIRHHFQLGMEADSNCKNSDLESGKQKKLIIVYFTLFQSLQNGLEKKNYLSDDEDKYNTC